MPLTFAAPWMLVALAGLPALWLILRLIPPRPQRIVFPPLRLLLGLSAEEETPARTPWWLLLLRLGLAALVILMLAGPTWRPQPVAAGAGPLLMLVDNGWASGGDWDQRLAAASERVAAAGQGGRPIAIVALADVPGDISLETSLAAREHVRSLAPEPWTPDRQAHLASIKAFLRANPAAEAIWISDGLAAGEHDDFVSGLRESLGSRALVVLENRQAQPFALASATNEPSALSVRVLRRDDAGVPSGRVRAMDLKGLPLGEAVFAFRPGERQAEARFDLPVDLRNEVARVAIDGAHQAGAVQLLDDCYRRRTVALVSSEATDTAQPLLSATYYLTRALQPFADIRTLAGQAPAAALDSFLEDRPPVIVLADVGVQAEREARLAAWVEHGGVLVRFAGSRLAAAGDALLPVTLRSGDRTLGGALSWEKPQGLGPFPDASPFAGLPVSQDVTVTRQVLAEPDAGLAGKIWAQLQDGTPLVTAERRGQGLIVLFHVTADTTWSSLPLSGSFVEMLRRVVALSGTAGPARAGGQGSGASQAAVLSPSRTLDGFGVLGSPPRGAQPIRADQPMPASLGHPPGFYGPPDGLVAVNTLGRDADLRRLNYGADPPAIGGLDVVQPVDLATPLLLTALLLLLVDALLALVLSGGMPRLRRAVELTGLALFGGLLLGAAMQPGPARSQTTAPATSFDAALKTRIAYVVTGDPETDATSQAGLKGLTGFLADRTALEPGEPIGIDLDRDELVFEPLIYWPVVAGSPTPSAAALGKIENFMRSGGLILFDTRDAITEGTGLAASPAGETLQRILGQLDIPELEPVPRNHVLTKTFFLLDSFPGRYENGQTWVQALPAEEAGAVDRPAVAGDGVSPLIITGNDLAAAWAVGDDGQPLYPISPGGERQREFAYRAGVNIVMYALTGNYKADQVHVPALLERLGQ